MVVNKNNCKKFLCLLIWCLILKTGICQNNIVSNGSFEGTDGDQSNCSSIHPEDNCNMLKETYSCYKQAWDKVDSWELLKKAYRITFDADFPTPDRHCAGQHSTLGAADGLGYLHGFQSDNHRKEIICTKLSTPLLFGNRYLIEFKHASDKPFDYSERIRVFFSEDQLKQSASGRIKSDLTKGRSFDIKSTVKHQWQTFYLLYYHLDLVQYEWLSLGPVNKNKVEEVIHYYFDDVKVFDLGPIEEQCPPIKYIQNEQQQSGIYEAEDELYSGHSVGALFPASTGNVAIATNANVVYKAGDFVSMEPGFETKPNANFLAYIEDCEHNPCEGLSSKPDEEVDICDNVPTSIHTDFNANTYNSIKWSPSANLSSPNVKSPLFTPPNNSGTQVYTVTATDACGNTAQQTIVVSWQTSVTMPTISVTSVVKNEYELSFDVNLNSESEWVKFTYKEKPSGTVIWDSGKLYSGNDYSGNKIEFVHPCGITSVCKDYEVLIETANRCNSAITSYTLDWNRSSYCNPKPQLTIKPNVFTPNGNGNNDVLCFTGCGFNTYSYKIWDRWENEIKSGTGVTCDGKGCIWDGGNSPDGQYVVEYSLFGCGNEHAEPAYMITLSR